MDLVAESKREKLKVFGPVWDGAGVRGFMREGYWYHRFVPNLSFEGSTFVTKTVTTHPTKGNMVLNRRFRPKALFPDCIVPYFRKGMVLNNVGLSGPGVEVLLRLSRWSAIQEPFFISYAPVRLDYPGNTRKEVREFVRQLGQKLPHFATKQLGIQLDASCPNVDGDPEEEIERVWGQLDELEKLNLPVVVKLSLLTTPHAASEIAKHPACTGICVANSIPFWTVMPPAWWGKHFPEGSPLLEKGYRAGGLSGAPLFALVCEWVNQFRKIDPDTYLHVGGGVTEADCVDTLYYTGADSIFFASVAITRPWRVTGIIKRAHKVYSKNG